MSNKEGQITTSGIVLIKADNHKECLRHGIEPFIIDDKHRSEYNRGIKGWETDEEPLTAVVMQAQLRFQGQIEICNLMEYCRPTSGRGARSM